MILSLWSRLTWTLFICFTAFHLIANHRAVSVVALETLNKNRLHILMQHYLANGSGLTVHYVNIREPILTSEEVAEEGLCFMLLFQFMFCHTSTQGQHVSYPMTLAAQSTGYSQSQFCFSLYLSLYHLLSYTYSGDEYRSAATAHGKGQQKFILKYHSSTKNGEHAHCIGWMAHHLNTVTSH